MWAMNAVDYSTHPEATTIDTTDEDANPTKTEITETVLAIELTHSTRNYGRNCPAALPRAVVNLCPRTTPAPQQTLCNGRFRSQEQLPRNLATVLTPLLAKLVPTPAPTLPAPRVRSSSLPQAALSPLTTSLTAELGRQLRLLHPNRPRRRAGSIIRTLFQHLRHHRPASAGCTDAIRARNG